MKKIIVIAGFLFSVAGSVGTAFGGDDVGASFVKQEGGGHEVSMKGSLAENNLSCKEKQPCQKLFDTVHDAAQNSFAGTFVGEIVDIETQKVREAEFTIGTLLLDGQEHRVIFEQDGAKIGILWVDPAAKINTELPIPTGDL